MCLDLHTTAVNEKLFLWPCVGIAKQFFAFEKSGRIITAENSCVGVNSKKVVILVRCYSNVDKTQLWTYDQEASSLNDNKWKHFCNILNVWHLRLQQQWVIHRESGLCVQNNGRAVILGNCNATDRRSQWAFLPTANVTKKESWIFVVCYHQLFSSRPQNGFESDWNHKPKLWILEMCREQIMLKSSVRCQRPTQNSFQMNHEYD